MSHQLTGLMYCTDVTLVKLSLTEMPGEVLLLCKLMKSYELRWFSHLTRDGNDIFGRKVNW